MVGMDLFLGGQGWVEGRGGRGLLPCPAVCLSLLPSSCPIATLHILQWWGREEEEEGIETMPMEEGTCPALYLPPVCCLLCCRRTMQLVLPPCHPTSPTYHAAFLYACCSLPSLLACAHWIPLTLRLLYSVASLPICLPIHYRLVLPVVFAVVALITWDGTLPCSLPVTTYCLPLPGSCDCFWFCPPHMPHYLPACLTTCPLSLCIPGTGTYPWTLQVVV